MVKKKDYGKRYDKLAADVRKARTKVAELREEAQRSGLCSHSRTEEIDRDMDDGYGHWWKIKIKRCLICETEEVVYRMGSGTGPVVPGIYVPSSGML